MRLKVAVAAEAAAFQAVVVKWHSIWKMIGRRLLL